MEDFQQFGLPQSLLDSLIKIGFDKPTPIQEQAIPLALEGHDILGSAQTGTGKTGAFGIPVIAKLIEDPKASALIVTPTRELATQVMQALQSMLGEKSSIKTALIIGGEIMGKQYKQLRGHPRLFVGTPGRLNDHLERGTLKLDNTKILVLDETDRMLDMGFSVQIEEILEHISDKHQTLLFSATLPKNIISLSKKYLVEPKRIAVGSTVNPAKNIKQDVIYLSDKEKYSQLVAQLHERKGSVIVFVKTKYSTERIAKKLQGDEMQSEAIHGDLKHSKRERVIRDFRNQKYRVLVATDVAARGLDIPHIEHVINYDLPQCPEDYIHRIGRTARAGAEGEALCFVTPSDKTMWNAINSMISGDESYDKNLKTSSKKSSSRKPRGGKKSYSEDRPTRDRSERPTRSREDKPTRDRSERPTRSREDKPTRDRSERPTRSREDKPTRDRSERPTRSREDRPTRDRSERPTRSREDRPTRDRSERPTRSREDRPTRGGKPNVKSDSRSRGRADNRNSSFKTAKPKGRTDKRGSSKFKRAA